MCHRTSLTKSCLYLKISNSLHGLHASQSYLTNLRGVGVVITHHSQHPIFHCHQPFFQHSQRFLVAMVITHNTTVNPHTPSHVQSLTIHNSWKTSRTFSITR
ncbi:hypothetical protein HanRHA438_Chr13g0629601 [Helianthus annuus]|nr:hypothetical protein HanRHA438_Chr13g0629601 [Helianthus annuus]